MIKIIPKRFKYEIIKIISLEDLVNYKDHDRLRVFYHKGCTCVTCGKVGTQLAIGIDSGGAKHIDLYTDNFTPITVDHIIPKSKGGSNKLDNLQPMCTYCNSEKGNGDSNNKPKPLLNLKRYTQDGIKVGDEVYRIGKKGRAVLIGEVKKFFKSSKTKSDMVGIFNDDITYNKKLIYKKK